MAYLRENPFVVVATVLAILALAAMLVTSLVSLRFLQHLRAEAPAFWAAYVGAASIGMLRIAGLTPARVAAMSTQGDVLRVCQAYAGQYRLWRTAAYVLIGATVIALFASGRRGG